MKKLVHLSLIALAAIATIECNNPSKKYAKKEKKNNVEVKVDLAANFPNYVGDTLGNSKYLYDRISGISYSLREKVADDFDIEMDKEKNEATQFLMVDANNNYKVKVDTIIYDVYASYGDKSYLTGIAIKTANRNGSDSLKTREQVDRLLKALKINMKEYYKPWKQTASEKKYVFSNTSDPNESTYTPLTILDGNSNEIGVILEYYDKKKDDKFELVNRYAKTDNPEHFLLGNERYKQDYWISVKKEQDQRATNPIAANKTRSMRQNWINQKGFSFLNDIPSSSSTTDKKYVPEEKYDEEYWRSVAREKELKRMGMKEAAKMERDARVNRLRGNGYTNPDGGTQVHYKGSEEQKNDLKAIDEYAKSHPGF